MAALSLLAKKYRIELWLILSGLIVLVGFGIVQRIILSALGASYVSFLGVPLDDVYIHARYSQNLAHGFSYSFNSGVTITADTSPLWVILLAIGSRFTSHLDILAIVFSAISYLILAPGVYRMTRDLFQFHEHLARFAGALTIVSSRLAWSAMSGMETALAALLLFLVVEEHIRSRRILCIRPREAMWLGLGLLVRPEFAFVAIVLAVDWLIISRKADLSRMPMVLLVLFAIASPAYFLPLLTSGSLVAHSSVVQGARVSLIPNFEYLWFALRILASNNIVLALLIVSTILFLWKQVEYRILIIIAFGLPLLQAFVAPQFRHHGRYFFPVIPLIVLIGIAAWQEARERWQLRAHAWKLIPVIAVLAGLIETGRWAYIESESVRNINDQHLAAAHWLNEHLKPSDTLAVHDVGAIGYFTNQPLIDLTGLMTPELWPLQHDQDSVWRWARARGANLFVIYRRLSPDFYRHHKDSLVLVQDFPVRLPLTSSADTVMSIYRLRSSGS